MPDIFQGFGVYFKNISKAACKKSVPQRLVLRKMAVLYCSNFREYPLKQIWKSSRLVKIQPFILQIPKTNLHYSLFSMIFNRVVEHLFSRTGFIGCFQHFLPENHCTLTPTLEVWKIGTLTFNYISLLWEWLTFYEILWSYYEISMKKNNVLIE